MPIENNGFSGMKQKQKKAQRAALKTMGIACVQVCSPNIPVVTGYLKGSLGYVLPSDKEMRAGVTATYGGYVHKRNKYLSGPVSANLSSIMNAGFDAYGRVMK